MVDQLRSAPGSSLSDMESVNPFLDEDERSSQLGNYDPEMEDPSDEDGPPPTKKAKQNLLEDHRPKAVLYLENSLDHFIIGILLQRFCKTLHLIRDKEVVQQIGEQIVLSIWYLEM